MLTILICLIKVPDLVASATRGDFRARWYASSKSCSFDSLSTLESKWAFYIAKTTITVGIGYEYNYDNIQAALNIADEGDTILVAEGTYNITNYIEWPNIANIKLFGAGANNTIIDAANNNHIFYLNGSSAIIDSNTIIDGFTLTNGNANGISPHDYGGAICCYSASPMITNNIINYSCCKVLICFSRYLFTWLYLL